MKILFDQNISFRILKLLPPDYHAAEQVRTVGLEGATDREIWDYAKENGFAIATFDADFADIAYVRGFPPKIIWFRTGNMTTPEIVRLMKQNKTIISNFLTADEYREVACLELA